MQKSSSNLNFNWNTKFPLKKISWYLRWKIIQWPGGLRRWDQKPISSSNLTRRSTGLRDPTSLPGSRWPSGRNSRNAVINIRFLRLYPRKWPKDDRKAAKEQLKKVTPSQHQRLDVYLLKISFLLKGFLCQINVVYQHPHSKFFQKMYCC